jgi:HK97 family phage major capsid protein/HK97 family phage prohead protease
MLERAYSRLEIRAVSESERVIEGIATTPTPDRMGDVINPMGATFAIPMPLLWQHDSTQPIGEVTFAKATPKGIPFRAQLAKADQPGALKDRLDEAWQSITLGLVKAVSIGFRALKYAFLDDGGIEFQEWEWLELSAVTIPANTDATITTIRSADAKARAATGRKDLESSTRPAPRLGTPATPNRKEGRSMPKTITEQIASFEATRQAKAAAMQTLMDASAETGETLDEAQAAEYDELAAEVEAIDKHLLRLRAAQKANLEHATPVVASDPQEAAAVRGGAPTSAIVVRADNTVPKGTAFTRYAIALMRGEGNLARALAEAKSEAGWSSTPEVLKLLEVQANGANLGRIMRAAVAAGTAVDPVWAGPLVQFQIMASEFVELLRPATILGRVPGFTRVPFNIKIPRQTAGSTVGWVGEGKAKPISSLAFDNITLQWAKCAGIVVLTDELVRFSNPAAEGLVQNDLIKAISQFLDKAFVDPAIAGVAGVSPPSITNGVPPIPASGPTSDDFRADLLKLKQAFATKNMSTAGCVLLMPETQADALGMILTPLGVPMFPGVNANGGTILGMPVITSQNDGLTGIADAPAGNRIVMLKPSEILLADDGQVMIDASREASLQMDSAPASPPDATTVFMSLWQENMVGLRAERWINWIARRTGAVQWISGAAYGS